MKVRHDVTIFEFCGLEMLVEKVGFVWRLTVVDNDESISIDIPVSDAERFLTVLAEKMLERTTTT